MFTRQTGGEGDRVQETTTVLSTGFSPFKRPVSVALIVPFSFLSGAGSTRVGLEDAILGVRYRADLPAVTRALSAKESFVMGVGGVELPTGTLDHRFGKDAVGGIAAALGSVEVGQFSVIGYGFYRRQGTYRSARESANLFIGAGAAWTPIDDPSGRILSVQLGVSRESMSREEEDGAAVHASGGSGVFAHPTLLGDPSKAVVFCSEHGSHRAELARRITAGAVSRRGRNYSRHRSLMPHVHNSTGSRAPSEGHSTGTCPIRRCEPREISERKRVEKAHQAADERYATLFAYAPDGILIADRESRYLDANPSMCRMLGYSRDELIGLHASDIVAPAETAHIAPALARIAETSEHHREWQFRRKDGSMFPAEVIATAMPNGNLLAMIRDVTERNQSDTVLRRTEERMRFALESTHVGIWDMDYVSGVFQGSDVLEEQYGLAPGTFDGTFERFSERIHPDDRASVLDIIGSSRKTGSDFTVLHRTIRPDGTVRWLSVAGRTLLDDRGQPLRAVGISQDVTERRVLEAQFQQAQKMEAIGRLAGGVAHDFNNLLTVILGFCELLLAGADPDDPRRFDITEIQKAGTRAAGLTTQLLAFSRKQIIEPTLLDLNTILSDMRPMLGRLIREDVKIMLGLPPRLGCVKADRGQVEQVLRQSHRQCAGCHAERRHLDDRNGQCRAR